ncbi:MAG: hypothetical protein WHV67_02375 [Thermoanaerobaculia bacterium]
MKKLYILLFLVVSSYSFSQCNMIILGDVVSNPAACANILTVKNARDNVAGNMHNRQAWALHYRDQVADIDGVADNKPAFTYTSSSNYGCQNPDNRCYAIAADNCSAYNTINSADHCKFVLLLEQIRNGIGEFAIFVAGQNVSDQTATDSIQSKMVARVGAPAGCSAFFSPVIGDCGSGAGIPCITSATPSGSNIVVTFNWAWPSDQAIMYTRDDEDTLGPSYNCPISSYGWNPTSRLNALQTIITGWEIFYAGSASSTPIDGIRTNWTATDDTDATRVQVGSRWYSTDTQATVVIPQSAGSYVFVAVSPVFDGNPGPGMRATLGTKSVTLEGVISRSSAPIIPTPVTITSFTARYVDLQNVKIDWETASETDALGFYLYRSTDRQNWVQVNSQIIPAKGQGGAGATYTYNDTVPKQRTYTKYYYKVEEISNSGQRTAQAETETTR